MTISFADKQLIPIFEKIEAAERLSYEDGVTLYRSRDLAGVGFLADWVRRRRHGSKAFFVYNMHLNYTNVCKNRCRFCAFARDAGADGAYVMTIADIRAKLESRKAEPIREIHIVGGVNPELPADYYFDVLKTVSDVFPKATIKAFTAVEIDHLAELEGVGLEDMIDRLKSAGLSMLPGGGAEVLSERIHRKLFPKKIDGNRWIEVMSRVHRRGVQTNATMLYGHIETPEERVEHLIRIRSLQDKTSGFSAFIPLAFHSKNTELDTIPGATGFEDLKNIAVSRLILDNIDHIKAYWVMLGEKTAQIALSFGADDLDGTIVEEKITHMAGAESAAGLNRDTLIGLIRSAGFVPVERDSFYHPVEIHEPAGAGRQAYFPPRDDGITKQEALEIFESATLTQIGVLADKKRRTLHPAPYVTFVVDRNINYSNICTSGCRFCAFYKNPGDPEGYVIERDVLAAKIEETLALGGTQILLQGGLNPAMSFKDHLDMLKFIKSFGVHIHGFSPPEIRFMADNAALSVNGALEALIDAGLNSIPGGGAEILCDDVRSRVSPGKCTADQWLAVMRDAHRLGLKSSATMMFGHLEQPRHIIDHLFKIRDLQNDTGGFTAFIPWTFQPLNTKIDVRPASSAEYLKVLALSRIILDNVPNIQASWVTQGSKIAQTALFFGANDLGSTMIEENVVKAAGVDFRLPVSEMIRLIEDAGFTAVKRDFFYRPIETKGGPH